jgi:hypothetical protein
VQPVLLGSSFVESGIKGVVAGWGLTTGSGRGELADHLQWIDSKTISNEECNNESLGIPIFDSTICAVAEVGTGP